VDRRCGSGLQAIIQAVMQVQSGGSDLVLAGGAESMSQAEFYATGMRWGVKGEAVALSDRLARARVTAGGRDFLVPGGMIETAENLRAEFSISREDQDALAVQSHQRAVAAQKNGIFAQEIVPVSVPQRKGDALLVDTDEHPRADTSMESLARLRPMRGKLDPDATVTAGNASGQNDGAALAIVTTAEKAKALGLRPLARLASWSVAGVPPRTMGIGPVPASEKALGRLGLTLADMDVIELNEAFAAQALAVLRTWNLEADDSRINPNGSGISLGHPVGATGGRILATLLREMDRREARYGLETMCIGGGQGLAAVFERLS
jgi:acetyl-CoA C-acetyltransferase